MASGVAATFEQGEPQRIRQHLICSARVPRMRARSYLVMYRVVMRGPSLGCGGPVITCASGHHPVTH